MNITQLIDHGGPIMWPLLACSLITLTVVIERALFWIFLERNRKRPLLGEILELARKGDWESIREKSANCRDYVIRVLIVGIVHRDYDMGKAMEAEGEKIVQQMNSRMMILDTMITVAPLLGILGTVLGIIDSFSMLGHAGLADPKLVTSGIAQALITTATGLIISIVAVLPYNFFNTRIERAIHTMEKYASSLEVVYDRLIKNGQSS